jgi:hypothetical protein
LRVTPSIAIVPAGRGATSAVDREIRVIVANHGKAPATADVRLTAPTGWRVTPASLPLSFTREDETQMVRFVLRPAAATPMGDYSATAVATVGTQTYQTGFQVVEYPHVARRQLEIPATVEVKVMDVRLAPNLTVGYVMGTGDDVPAALRGLGASVQLLQDDDLAWGDLGRFNAVVVGVRAYDSREALRANNKRLLDYASNGGIVVVQ